MFDSRFSLVCVGFVFVVCFCCVMLLLLLFLFFLFFFNFYYLFIYIVAVSPSLSLFNETFTLCLHAKTNMHVNLNRISVKALKFHIKDLFKLTCFT